MTANHNDHGAYVRKVREGTQTFTQDLLGEIDRLRVLVASLEAEKETYAERGRDVELTVQANEALRALASSLEAEMNRLHEQAVALRSENDRHHKEQQRLQAQLERIHEESREYSTRYAEVEQQNSNLANLYVASYRLHGTVDRQEVVDTIQEIIANLVGSEEAGLFELDAETQTLRLVASFGILADSWRTLPLGEGPISEAVKTGTIFVAEPAELATQAENGAHVTACVPLTLDGRVTGAIAIFRLLPQKAAIEDLDRELFGLLATHAATALYCTSLHARCTAAEACA